MPDSEILRPQPRRLGASFSLAPESTNTSPTDRSPEPASERSTPVTSPVISDPRSNTLPGEAALSNGNIAGNSTSATPQKTRSILNLTSSTLFGIYSPVGYDVSRDGSTPWGNGAQTPARSRSGDRDLSRIQVEAFSQISAQNMAGNTVSIDGQQSRRSRSRRNFTRPTAYHSKARANPMHILLRTAVLLLLGMAYGEVIAHLQNTRNIASVPMDVIDRDSWAYLLFWGLTGVVLGLGLPWVDSAQRWGSLNGNSEDAEDTSPDSKFDGKGEQESAAEDEGRQNRSLGTSWNPVVRSVGAFVGIAFAIRKLPWHSTLQVSLTLALVNPVMWYLIDRTKAGLTVATIVGFAGSAVSISINPDWVPQPTTSLRRPSLSSPALGFLNMSQMSEPGKDMLGGMVSVETAGVATWISSVLFCSCLFFGNIGRRLAMDRGR